MRGVFLGIFNPIVTSDNIKDGFVDYITTAFKIGDDLYAKQLKNELEKDGFIAKGPYIDVTGSYETKNSISELIASGDASSLFSELEPVPEKDRELKMDRPLYTHQQEALVKANNGNNLVITTGTGSGKTECFLIPIINSLLKEIEHDTLNAGVRAIIIYPMNALAFDQIKRMRLLFKNYPKITFGLYNGNTEYEDKEALAAYKLANGPDAVPLENELISRSSMQQSPPNILITNYSMLEYMLLRPNDDIVFSGAKLNYIVLDEAHIYRGTTGMETAMLMRRLRARIPKSNRETVQFILTSATLGGKDADDEIVEFAKRLCEVDFKTENIIRSKDATPPMLEYNEYPIELFSELAKSSSNVVDLFEKYGVNDYAPEGDDFEKLYELLLRSSLFCEFVNNTRLPVSVSTLQEIFGESRGLTKDQLIDFIEVCTKAEKEKSSLIKAKYHFFVRAIEGAYVTLNEPKKLFLQRKNRLDETRQCVFELAVCEDCGRIAIVGQKGTTGFYEQVARKNNYNTENCNYYIVEDTKTDSEMLDDEGDVDDEVYKCFGETSYVVCSCCGKMSARANLHFKKLCECDEKNHVYLTKARTTSNGIVKCPACGFGTVRAFYVGNEAATAVLGTELFEQLPSEQLIISNEVDCDSGDVEQHAFFKKKAKKKKTTEEKEKQFLCFSDSRSEAAFFANYMEKSYQEFLRRRAIIQVMESLKNGGMTEISVGAFVERLVRFFEVNKTFDLWNADGKKDKDRIRLECESNAWVAVLNELFNARRATSLCSLGLMSFEYVSEELDDETINGMASYFKLSNSEMKSLLNLLILDGVFTGAINAGNAFSLNDAEREYVFFSPYEKKLTKCRDENSKTGQYGWSARKRENGSYYPNSKVQRLKKSTGIDDEEANSFLLEFWENVFQPNDDNNYVIDACDFKIKLSSDPNLKFYCCSKCGRITPHNIKNQCATVKCDGLLTEIDIAEVNKNNHYVKLYNSKHMRSLQIKEHTAQLSRNQQSRYQQAFVKNEINALSCSTTFEMGIDVGGLESVYMRNVPPSPSNYVQRAGRAGRALHSAAYILTYARLSSHDFTFFNDPRDMISGKINAPVFELENEKVINRHIYAVALSKFFASHESVYDNDNQDNFLNGHGYEDLKEYLNSKPEDLKSLLRISIPRNLHDRFGINDFSWAENLIGNDGVLDISVNEYRTEIETLEKEISKCRRKHNDEKAGQLTRALRQFRSSKDDGVRKKSLIEFLVRSNVLPKYGFPVDTVELITASTQQEKGETLQLQRDLQLAIAEYAPGSEIIADGKLYKSRYIRKLPGKDNSTAWEKGHYAECPICEQPNFSKSSIYDRTCIACGVKIPPNKWETTLEPRRGFVVEGKPKEAPLRKPDRDFRTDEYYIGDNERKCIEKVSFTINDRIVELESTSNDSLALLGRTKFNLCELCGYASEENIPTDHFDSRGYKCKNKTGRHKSYRLSHTFKTFVTNVTFYSKEATDYSTMLSVLYALLEGLSQELGIERNDIKGCLFKKSWEESNLPIYSLILYDAVAGGAGHVRRLVTEDGESFKRVLKRAYAITSECDCSPSCYHCLRNYYNSKIHDDLDRKKASDFLELWLGNLINNLSIETDSSESIEIVGASSLPDYQSWTDYSEAMGLEIIDSWDNFSIPMDTCKDFCELKNDSFSVQAQFVWEEKKIALFEASELRNTTFLIDAGWTVFEANIAPNELSKLF